MERVYSGSCIERDMEASQHHHQITSLCHTHTRRELRAESQRPTMADSERPGDAWIDAQPKKQLLAWLQRHASQDYLQRHRLLGNQAKVLKRNKKDALQRKIREVAGAAPGTANGTAQIAPAGAPACAAKPQARV